MSRLQQSSKSFLEPLFAGDFAAIKKVDVDLLRRWAYMFFSVHEAADPQTQVSKFEDREFFAQTGSLPENTLILIGQGSASAFNSGVWHWGAVTQDEGDGSFSPMAVDTAPIGRLVLQMVSAWPALMTDPFSYAHSIRMRLVNSRLPMAASDIPIMASTDIEYAGGLLRGMHSQIPPIGNWARTTYTEAASSFGAEKPLAR